MKNLFSLLLFILISTLLYTDSYAQMASCTPDVPYYYVNLVGSPSGSWTSPSHTRSGSCCTGQSNCTSFDVAIDTAAGYIQLQIASGASPSGALFFQVNCGPLVPIASPSMVTGPGPFHITFCKAGNNANTYLITTFPRTAGQINGNGSVVMCTSSTLSIGIPGGTWSSSNTAVASINNTTGVLTGVSAGTAVVSYIVNTSLINTTTVTVTPVPPITGSLYVCGTNKTTLSDATAGGQWFTSSPGQATINSSGIVTGVSTGTTTISYKLGTGCITTAVVTVNGTLPAITGTKSLCAGNSTTFADAAPLGTWTSGNVSAATISATTGIAYAVAAGTSNITYSVPGGCITTAVMTTNPLPPAITGTAAACVNATSTLANTMAGGTWSSSNITIATVTSGGGIVAGVSSGNSNITYTSSAGCIMIKQATINPLPVVSGTMAICEGWTITLSSSMSGGNWGTSSGSASVNSAGAVTGLVAGNATVSYQSAAGCVASTVVTVLANPAPINAPSTMCTGNTITMSCTTCGGTWLCTYGIPTTLDSARGTYTPGGSGPTMLIYTAANGCRSYKNMTVNPAPAITGKNQVCKTLTTTLSCAVPGGTWTSNHPEIASIGSTGIVSGVNVGSAIISYDMSVGCKIGRSVVVDTVTYPLQTSQTFTPALHDMCIGNCLQLQPVVVAGGTWMSSNTAVMTITTAPVMPDGLMTAVAPGTVTLTYTFPNGCNSTYNFTVHTMPVMTSPAPTICRYATVGPFTASPSGGQWFSMNQAILSIGINTSMITAAQLGTAMISYRMYGYNGCSASFVATVNNCTAGKESGEENGAFAENLAAGYSIYPNPGDNDFTITQNIPADGVTDVAVINCMGQPVFRNKVTFTGGKGSLDLPNVPPGIYIIAIVNDAQEKNTMHLVVQR